MANNGESFGLTHRPDAGDRQDAALVVIDQILNGTPDGTVNPALGQDLRQKLLLYPGEPDRALLEHLRTQFHDGGVSFDAVFPEDLDN